jgi:3-hydroxybutyryl-CoA dehydrogenase
MQQREVPLAFLGSGPAAVALAHRALRRGLVIHLCAEHAGAPALGPALTPADDRSVHLLQASSVLAVPPETLLLLDLEGVDGAASVVRAVAEALDQQAVLLLLLAPVQSLAPLAAVAPVPGRVVGVRLSVPWLEEPLAELVTTAHTADRVPATVMYVLQDLGCIVVPTADLPGLVATRLLTAFHGEVVRIVAEGAAPAVIDRVLSGSGLSDEGAFMGMERLGLRTAYTTGRALYEASFQEPRYRPHPLMERMVARGLVDLDAEANTGRAGDDDGSR